MGNPLRAKTVISFDDLYHKGPAGQLPREYCGFTWCEKAWFLTKGYYSAIPTGRRVALFNAHGEDISFEREPAFDLTGLSLSPIWEQEALVLVEGMEKGSTKYSSELTIYRNVVTRAKLDFRGIDRVNLSTGGTHVMVEEISVILKNL